MAQRTSSNVLGATLLGGVAGATIALLFAPRSGRETRERIKQTAHDMKEGTSDTMSRARGKVKDGIDTARDMKDRVAQAAKETKEDVAKRGRRTRDAMEEEV